MKANASLVSRKLATRYERSKTYSTRIRGWYDFTPGFEAKQGKNAVFISYNFRNKVTPEQRLATLNGIAEFLIAAGMDATVGEYSVAARERVSA